MEQRPSEAYSCSDSDIICGRLWDPEFIKIFYVLLTVHLSIILVINQLNAQILVS